ncbi:hypothetical protein R6Q57_002885 [Mikania cordata]
MSANVKTYDGLGDPDEHLERFSSAATIELWCLALWCHMFSQTLVGPARLWFHSLPDGRPPKPLSKATSERNPNKFCDFHEK